MKILLAVVGGLLLLIFPFIVMKRNMKPIRGTGIIQMRNTLNFFLASSVF